MPAHIALSLVHVVKLCQKSALGKSLPNAFYIHRSALPLIEKGLRYQEQLARQYTGNKLPFTLIKFHYDRPNISYLYYPEFDDDPHPVLRVSTIVNYVTGKVESRDYSDAPNPPLLHRKETFISPDYPNANRFAHLTQQQELIGLLDDSRRIGTLLDWERKLAQQGLEIHNHALACLLKSHRKTAPKIQRHRAAIARVTASKPVRLAIEAGLFSPDSSYFDYGCGHGADIEYIKQLGHTSNGWDPHFQPDVPHSAADVVNLGYVINVIEDLAERREALVRAWSLAKTVLIVAAQVLVADRSRGAIPYGDGIVTQRRTFQKYYEQEELKTYIDGVLNVDSIPVALGIYFVFRDEARAQTFRASRFRSRATAPRIRSSTKRFEDFKDLLSPLMAFFTERGRLPIQGELLQERQLISEFSSIKRAFRVVIQATNSTDWETISHKRRQDLQVYLALSQFSRRPKFSRLPPTLQADIRALFGTYKTACTCADEMLFGLRNMDSVAEASLVSSVGQQRPNSLLVHITALSELPPVLRLYEGCASRTIGRMEEATVVKLHLRQPKIAYLVYPDFDLDPHPALATVMQIDLRDLRVRYQDFNPDLNPPILHRKQELLTPDYPNYNKFHKLSQQEELWGLLDNPGAIGNRVGWERCLKAHCAELKGHRLVRSKDADPYRLKLLRSQVRARKKKQSPALCGIAQLSTGRKSEE